MRGKDHQTFQLVLRDGITPACAGKSRPCVVHVCRTEDHPRVCGEKALSTFSSLKNSGSPPHVRGKVQTEFCMIVIGKDHPRVCGEKWPQNIHEYHRLGITPAYAGKSYRLLKVFVSKPGSPPRMRGKVLFCPLSCFQFKDHPRVCGEKISGTTLITTQQGSPPRMRGKAASGFLSALVCRITPAYAGKRYRNARSGQYQRDHPRVCGEKAFMAFCRNCAVGSPPRMRGKVCFLGCISVLTGITPAYAGKSYLIGTGLSDTKDHPRVCGEKTVLDLSRLVEQGSPPRMRGKADPPSARFRVHGITPAYAGKRVL